LSFFSKAVGVAVREITINPPINTAWRINETIRSPRRELDGT
jgi:hypothetical protein